MPTGVLKYQEWYRLLPWALAAFFFGTWGFHRCGDSDPDATVAHALGNVAAHTTRFADAMPNCSVGITGWADAATQAIFLIKPSFQYLVPGYPWQLTLGALLFIVVVFFGVVRLAIQNIRYDARVTLAKRKKNHAIICELGQTGAQIARNFHQTGFDLIVITLDASSSEAQSLERQGILVLKGDAAQPGLLMFAGLARANALVICSGSDAANVEIGMRAVEALGTSKRPIKILAQIRTKWLFDTIVDHSSAVLGNELLEFRLFNVSDATATALLQSPTFAKAYPITESNPKLLLIGLGECGSDLLIGAVLGNFALPNMRASATIIDSLGANSRFLLERKCPKLDQLLDMQFKTSDLTSDNPQQHLAIADAIRDSAPDSVVVALDDDDISLLVSLEVRRALDMTGKHQTPVFVRLRQKQNLGKFLATMENASQLADRLVPFGDLSGLTTPEVLLVDRTNRMARVVHGVFREAADTRLATNVAWERLSEKDKQQNRSFAEHIPVKLRLIGREATADMPPLTEDEIETLARVEHGRWRLVHRAHGWSYGAVRDNHRRVHPLLVEWEKLPGETKKMNRAMVARIPEILSKANSTA